MSTPEHELFLQALRSAADSIEPRSDGFDQIRARLRRRPYPLPVAWAAAAWMRLTMRVREGANSGGRQVADKLRLASAGAQSAGRQVAGKLRWAYTEEIPADGKVGEKLRTISEFFLSDLPEPVAETTRHGKPSSWSLLRPLTAFGVAVFIVAVGAYVAIEVPAVVSIQNSHTPQSGNNNPGAPNGSGREAGHSSSPIPSSGTGGSTAPSGRRPSPSCQPVILPSPSSSARPTTSPSRTASPSPSRSPSPTPTPTPSTTSTPTPNGSTSAAAGAGQPTAGASAGAARTATDAVILPATSATRTVKSSCPPSPRTTKRATKKHHSVHTRTPFTAGLVTPAKSARPQSG